ncbi:MAG: alpha/beta fold hydrolase [Actinomycetota bacterium]
MNLGYVVGGGIRLFYVEEGTGPLVLLLHGFPEYSYSWRNQLGPLAEAGFRAVAVDLPGYGRSDKPDASYNVLWVNSVLADVIPALGHESAVVVGHDFGGLMAWPFARMYPERTAGVIGVNTPDLPRPPVPPTIYIRESGASQNDYVLQFQKRGPAEDLFERDPEGFLRFFFTGPACVRKEVFTDAVIAAYLDPLRMKGAITPPLEYYRNLDTNWDLTEDIAGRKIEVPCLMITAEGDPVLHPGLAKGMESRVPNLTTVLIEDCGHWTQQEQPEATTRHMLEYLKSLDPWP